MRAQLQWLLITETAAAQAAIAAAAAPTAAGARVVIVLLLHGVGTDALLGAQIEGHLLILRQHPLLTAAGAAVVVLLLWRERIVAQFALIGRN